MKEFMVIVRCDTAAELAAALSEAAIEVQAGQAVVDAMEVDAEFPFPGRLVEDPAILHRCG